MPRKRAAQHGANQADEEPREHARPALRNPGMMGGPPPHARASNLPSLYSINPLPQSMLDEPPDHQVRSMLSSATRRVPSGSPDSRRGMSPAKRQEALAKIQDLLAQLAENDGTTGPASAHRVGMPNAQVPASDASVASTAEGETDKEETPFVFHERRKSILEKLLDQEGEHFKTIYNIAVAILLVLFSNTMLENYYDRGSPFDFQVLFYAFEQFHVALLWWLILFIGSFLPYVMYTMELHKSSAGVYLYAFYQAFNIIYPGYKVYNVRMAPASAMIVTTEAVRLGMKMHSFWMYVTRGPLPGVYYAHQRDRKMVERPSLENYMYFLWIPTLIYQPSYPMRSHLRLSRGFIYLGETATSILFTYSIFERLCVPTIRAIEDPNDIRALVRTAFQLTLPSFTVFILSFFGVLHCWMNAFAEFTCFADRQFYKDWWNARSWADFYRRWNVIAHNWLHNYVFLELINQFQMEKWAASLLTIVLSASVHEYVIACSLGFFYPIMMILFSGPGVFFIYLTRHAQKQRWLNVFMWTMLIVGNATLLTGYARVWYFFKDNSKTGTSVVVRP